MKPGKQTIEIKVSDTTMDAFLDAFEEYLHVPAPSQARALRDAADDLLASLHQQSTMAKRAAIETHDFFEATYWKSKECEINSWPRWPARCETWLVWLNHLRASFPAVKADLEARYVAKQEDNDMEEEDAHKEIWISLENHARILLQDALRGQQTSFEQALARKDIGRIQHCIVESRRLRNLWTLNALPAMSEDWHRWLASVPATSSRAKTTLRHLYNLASWLPDDMPRPPLELLTLRNEYLGPR